MPALLLTAPILPGKLDAWRRFVGVLLGERRTEYRAVIRETGLSRLRVWHQRGPAGEDAAVVLYEGASPERFLQRIATGKDDFAGSFRAALVECHGIDLSQPPPPPPELAIDEIVD